MQIYNSLTRRKQEFVPRVEGKVGIYVCGMTVYDLCHIGHARVMVVFDTVVRHLRAIGYEVTYVRNVTDIDDKIIARANENGEDINVLTSRFIDAMHEDERALGVLPPDIEPRATTSMDEILSMVEALVDKGLAYHAKNGDVYYDVSKFSSYGQLSGKQIEDLRSGSRVDVDEAKDDPLDFVLWKSAKPDEPSWESPWGDGRPGWHIECSAMSTTCLGNHFDIHGGGMDLQFPHHENEIAQSEGATGEKFVNLWMHNGFVRVDEEKMSKSLGNFFTVREVLAKYPAEAVRYFILTSHYRSPLNYSDVQLDNARNALERFYTALRDLPEVPAVIDEEMHQRFTQAMNDDFNTPEALAVLFEIAREVNRQKDLDMDKAAGLASGLKQLAGVLGLLQDEPESFLHGGQSDDETAKIEAMIAARVQAREDKDWGEADRLREELTAMGIILEDTAGKTIWRRS